MPRTKRPRAKLDRASTIKVPVNQVNPMNKAEGKMGRTADFSQIGYKVIEAADYEVEAMSYEWKDPKDRAKWNPDQIDPTTNKPYQYANVKIQVTDPSSPDGDDVEGHTLFDKFSKNPKSLFVLKRAAIAFGEDPSIFEAEVDPNNPRKRLPLILDLDEIIGRMIGRRAIATVAVREYTPEGGEPQESNEITKYGAVESTAAISAGRR